jgi:hypothetical protein
MAKGEKTAGNHIMDKAKRQVMSSNGIKLTSNGINVEDGFQHLVGRAEHGDPHAQRQLRNGKYAFPHLRDFDSLPKLEGDQLIDHFITALTTQPKHLYANYKARGAKTLMKQISISLQRAHRFRVDDDLVERVLFDSAGAEWEKIFDVINNAVPPFDNMWIEGERNSRLFQRWRNDDTHFAPEWVGWHIQRAGAIRSFKEGDIWPLCLVGPTTLHSTSDDTIVVQKYLKPQSHATENLSYYIPKTCYLFTGKEHISKMPYEANSKSFQCLGEHWSAEIRDFAPAHIRMNLEKRITSSLGISYPLDDYGIMLKQPQAMATTVTSSTAMYEDDIRMLAWLLSELNFTWHESKLVGKPTRKNRALVATKPTIDLKTIEIDLPKPRGIVLRTETPSEEGCRKLHWVRGHTRKYQDGRIVRIEPYQRGNEKFGEVIKDYSLKLDKRQIDD